LHLLVTNLRLDVSKANTEQGPARITRGQPGMILLAACLNNALLVIFTLFYLYLPNQKTYIKETAIFFMYKATGQPGPNLPLNKIR